jgi:hypothetical protein
MGESAELTELNRKPNSKNEAKRQAEQFAATKRLTDEVKRARQPAVCWEGND